MQHALGLLGGSFDPIHFGHLQLARDARDALGLSEVRLIPAARPWQKGEITASAQRARMVELAIAGEPGLTLDTRELQRPGASYTIDTLRELRAELGPNIPLVLILGGDQWERMATWRDWQQLTDYAHIAVARRNDQPLATRPEVATWATQHSLSPTEFATRPAGGIFAFSMTPIDLSATRIREELAQASSPTRDAHLARAVPAAVLDYIRAQTLYRNLHGH